MQGAAPINILRHNCTSLPTKKKKGSKKPNPSEGTKPEQLQQQTVKPTPVMIEIQISVPDVVIPHMHQDLIAQQRNTNSKQCTKIGHFTKMCFTKNVHPQPQHYHKGKPKQAHQIIVPEQSTEQYKNTHKCDDDDDFMIAFQLHAQPQKNVHNQRVTIGYTQKCLYANIPYRL